jgi:hypothetical protein
MEERPIDLGGVEIPSELLHQGRPLHESGMGLARLPELRFPTPELTVLTEQYHVGLERVPGIHLRKSFAWSGGTKSTLIRNSTDLKRFNGCRRLQFEADCRILVYRDETLICEVPRNTLVEVICENEEPIILQPAWDTPHYEALELVDPLSAAATTIDADVNFPWVDMPTQLLHRRGITVLTVSNSTWNGASTAWMEGYVNDPSGNAYTTVQLTDAIALDSETTDDVPYIITYRTGLEYWPGPQRLAVDVDTALLDVFDITECYRAWFPEESNAGRTSFGEVRYCAEAHY